MATEVPLPSVSHLFQKFDFHDTEFVLGFATIRGLEEVEFASGGFCHLDDASKGIFVFTRATQSDGNVVGLHLSGRFQVDITEASLSLAVPDELFAGIDFEWITAPAHSLLPGYTVSGRNRTPSHRFR